MSRPACCGFQYVRAGLFVLHKCENELFLILGVGLNVDFVLSSQPADGSVKLSVSNEGEFSVVNVSDTGIGIPPEHQSRVFERFYRVDKSHSKEVGGTGLGLSIVKHSAMVHNAKIDLQSTPGKGTSITVRFPKA